MCRGCGEMLPACVGKTNGLKMCVSVPKVCFDAVLPCLYMRRYKREQVVEESF